MRQIAIVYTRLSFKTKDDISPERQLELCSAEARRRGWTPEVHAELEGHRSGRSEKHRPEWVKVKEALASRDDVIALVANDTARVTRSLRDLLELLDILRKRDIAFVPLKEGQFDTTTPAGRLMLNVIGALNEWYSGEVSERLRAHYEYLRDAGARFGKNPLGLKAVGKGKDRHLVVSDETYAVNGAERRYFDTAVEWLRLYTGPEPVGTYQGAIRLNERGFRWRTNQGQPRAVQSVDLRHIVETLETYEPFLPAELCRRALERRTERSRRAQNGRRPQQPPPLLWRLLYCAECGYPYVVHHNRETGRVHYRHERCDCHSRTHVLAEKIDGRVWLLVNIVLQLTPEERRELVQSVSPQEEDDAVGRKERLRAKLARLEQAYVDEQIGGETYQRNRAALLAEIESIPDTSPRRSVDEQLEVFNQTAQNLSDSDAFVRNAAMRRIFKRIIVDKGRVVRWELCDSFRAYKKRLLAEYWVIVATKGERDRADTLPAPDQGVPGYGSVEG